MWRCRSRVVASDIVEDALAFHRAVTERLRDTPAVVVAHIVRHRGSTPRKTGAHMLIDPSGSHLGTVGGGCGEAEVLARAHRVLGTGEPALTEVRLLEEHGWDSPSICGGVLDVFLERIGPTAGGIAPAAFMGTLDGITTAGRAAVVATVVATSTPGQLGRKTIIDGRGTQHAPLGDAALDAGIVDGALTAIAESRPHAIDVGDARVYLEVVADPPELVVVGAGHVGAALARLAGRSGFQVVVVDDRQAFANPVRLPEAHGIVVEDPVAALRALGPRADRHVVLVTRGHQLDAECLRVALGMELAYLGMIGSRRRVARIREQLLAEGVDPSPLARLHAPIGLDIGAETPAEIAIAILAEIIDHRRGGHAGGSALSARARR